MQTEIGLSERKLKRQGVLEPLRCGGLSQEEGARELGRSTPQVRRRPRADQRAPSGFRIDARLLPDAGRAARVEPLGRDDAHADARDGPVAGQAARGPLSSVAGATGEQLQINGSPHDWFEGRHRAAPCSYSSMMRPAISRRRASWWRRRRWPT